MYKRDDIFMKKILGKWVQAEGQPFAGLCFEFFEDSTFQAIYESMSITSSGTFQIDGNQIDIKQDKHTFGLVGHFKGIYEISDEKMKLALPDGPSGDRPSDFSLARDYIRKIKQND